MTAFAIVCAVMLAAALVWLVLPLWRPKPEVDASATKSERRTSLAGVVLLTPMLAVLLYASLSNWDWDTDTTLAVTGMPGSVEEMVQRLENKLAANPDDVDGWLMLGRSYTTMGRFPRAADAYQQAYDLTKGENVEAVIGLGEALALTDEASLSGRAGQLFEAALVKAPNHPKALWYGSMVALQSGDLRRGRDRLQALLAQGPPDQLRGILERQVQDLNQQLGDSGSVPSSGGEGSAVASAAPLAQGNPPASPSDTKPQSQRVIRVAVSIAPDIQKQLSGPMAMFVLARQPGVRGPPLAVKRLSSSSAPFTVELTEGDAMIQGRTIASVPQVEVLARLSHAGTAAEASGDFYGQADYEFAKDAGTLQLVIDRTVP